MSYENMREEYIINQDGKDYHFTMEMVSNDLLRVHCREEGTDACCGDFVAEYLFSDIKSSCGTMRQMPTLEDAILEIDDCLVRHRVQVINDESTLEVDVHMDTLGQNEIVAFILEWHGDCRYHEGLHNPERLDFCQRDQDKIRREQEELKQRLNNCLQSQGSPSSYPPDERHNY